MSAAILTSVPASYRTPVALSAAAHVGLLLVLSSGFILLPSQPMQQLAIEAVVVDQGAIQRAAEQERQEKRAEQRRREAETERQRQAEQQRQQLENERAQTEKRRVEAERQKQLAQQKAAEQQRRETEAKAAEERKRKEAADAARRAEEKRVAEAEAKAAAEQQEQQRRQAELAAVLAAEEEFLAARQSGALNQYMALIQQKVQRKWSQPASAVAGVECEVSVQQLPGGEVVDARVTRCNADEAVRRSVENAVRAASPLPMPDDRRLFDRHLVFTFRPELQN